MGLSSLPLTRATRVWPRPTALAVALRGLGFATLLSALAPSFEGVLVTRLLAAGGHGLFWSVLMVYAASIAPAGREARAISVVLAGPSSQASRAAARHRPVGLAGLALGGRLGRDRLIPGALLLPTLLPAARSRPRLGWRRPRRVGGAGAG